MERKFAPGQTSSPQMDNGEPVSPVMDPDSFLEDMDMFNTASVMISEKYSDRHITKRSISPPKKLPVTKEAHPERVTATARPKYLTVESARIQKPAKRETRSDAGPTTPTEIAPKPSESCTKNNLAENTRRSRNSKDTVRVRSDIQRKRHSAEAKIPTPTIEVPKEHNRESDGARKPEGSEVAQVGLLNAIKELITTYTKQESAKILRTVHDLHINTLSNMIKNRMCQVDELKREFRLGDNGNVVPNNGRDNDGLVERIALLELDLGLKSQEIDRLKEENAELKSKLGEMKTRRSVEAVNTRRS